MEVIPNKNPITCNAVTLKNISGELGNTARFTGIISTSNKKTSLGLADPGPQPISLRGTLPVGPQHSGQKTLSRPALASIYEPMAKRHPPERVSVKRDPSTLLPHAPFFFFYIFTRLRVLEA